MAMHEFSVMQEVIRVVKESAQDEGIDTVEKIKLTVGELSCAHPPALETAFSVLSQDEPLLQHAQLEICQQQVVVRCRECGHREEIGEYEFICRGCGSADLEVLQGEQLSVDEYEGH